MILSRLPALLTVFAVTAFAPGAVAQGKKSEDVVKITAQAEKPAADGTQVVTIKVTVEAPYHLYANPVGNDMLKSAATTLAFTTKLEGTPKIDYPEGLLKKDEVVGDYRIYEDSVTLKATIQRSKGDTSAPTFTLKFQACDDKTCLLPSRVKVTAE